MNLHPRRSLRSAPITLSILLLLWSSLSVTAQEDNKPPKGFTALFNGQDFNDLVGGLGDVDPRKIAAMPEAERAARQKKLDEGAREHWHVKDGVLISDGDPKFFLSTPRDYRDFEMWVDWKINKDGDSGIYLRGIPQVQIWDPSDEKVIKLGSDKGSGALWNNKVHERWPKVIADKPVGQWNRMYIRMVGPYVTVKLNDKLVTDNVVLENYFDAKTPVPAAGPIYLQTHTTQLFFRNIFVRDIPTKEADEILSKIRGDEAGFKPLFNGKDLAGWTNATDAYEVKDGMLVSKAGKHGNMFTKEEYDNFVVRLEFKMPHGANNGLGIRSPITDKEVAYVGMESQILDDGDSKYKGWLHPYQVHGSLYGMAPAHRGYLRPVGEWNCQELTLDGDKLKVELNGFEILNTNISEVSKKPMDGKEHPGASRKNGHFGLLGHQDPVAFRNIRIKRLSPETTAAAEK